MSRGVQAGLITYMMAERRAPVDSISVGCDSSPAILRDHFDTAGIEWTAYVMSEFTFLDTSISWGYGFDYRWITDDMAWWALRSVCDFRYWT